MTTADVARVRFALSPLSETILGLRAAVRPAGHPLHEPWLRRAHAELRREPELPLLRTVLGSYLLPSFLIPVPEQRAPSLATELDRLAAVDPEFIRVDCVDALGERAAAGLPPVPVLLRRVLAAVRRCHERLIEPYWVRMGALLDADLDRRATALVDRGVEGLFADLHHDIAWYEGELLVRPDCTGDARVDASGNGLVLLPSVFGWPDVWVDHSPVTAASIHYPATGIGLLWEQPPGSTDGLAAVLGPTRAALLDLLALPSTTPGLAARLGITPGAVSQHLSALRRAGLVATTRRGREALHLRTPRAAVLFGTEPADR
ncbi:ArsR/SmtB family transcription factor [Micromonospora citrea]|uniref:ArsR/SmtB family transcription factor n=1 Tax=Micromonospora citrea TaxID=47855 RepID=UPI001C40377F|nr:DUF5937 family protein [Micromonospora citrea]